MDKSAMSALKLGHARGAALATVVRHRLPISEYEPRVIKQSLVGRGAADKTQVQHMVRLLLNLPDAKLQADAADALAVALTHAHMSATAHAQRPDTTRSITETPLMIGRLKGILVHKQPPWLVVDVHGVGYELEAPMSTFYDLPDVGREVALFTHYAQKEDSVSLYGFLRESERRLFRDVQKVSGIGAKIALAVLSGVSVDEFARLVQASDVTALTRIPGIGKKTAERMVVELRDRAADFGGGGGRSARAARRSAVRSGERAAATGLQAGRSRAHGARSHGRRRRRRHHHPQGAKVRAPLSRPAGIPCNAPCTPTRRMPTASRRARPRQGRPCRARSSAPIGVVFGDIGTSPLYTIKEAFLAALRADARPRAPCSACCRWCSGR